MTWASCPCHIPGSGFSFFRSTLATRTQCSRMCSRRQREAEPVDYRDAWQKVSERAPVFSTWIRVISNTQGPVDRQRCERSSGHAIGIEEIGRIAEESFAQTQPYDRAPP